MTPELDRSVAVLIVKVGRYPLHHGGIGAIRTLGRAGVPVDAVTEDRFTPAAVSRYLRRRFVWPTTGAEDPAELVEGLLRIGRRIEGRVIALPTDDEAAVLLAENAPALAERFEFPEVPAALPLSLADKFALYELCRAHGVAAPASARPDSVDALFEAAGAIGYPVVLKNAAPWSRLRRPAVSATTMVGDEAALRAVADGWTAMPSVLVQEYVPRGRGGEDWMTGVYCDRSSTALVVFTGVKVRSWPPGAGVATRAYAAANDVLGSLTAGFCRAVGYRGAGDLDWRYDATDGRYKLLDFNPRVGAQFRLFETAAGVDVVRALHLDLTGRAVPPGPAIEGRSLQVEHLDVAAFIASRRGRRAVPRPRGKTERVWLHGDDPLPAVSAAVRSLAPAAAMLSRAARGSKR